MTTVWDITIEVHEAITLPRMGDPVLWCGDPSLKVAGEVIAVDGHMVSIHVAAPATVLRNLRPGQADAWLVETPPYTGIPVAPKRDQLSALFRTQVARTDDTASDAREDDVTAMVAAGSEATREYQ
jgi:hypothetical protein